MKQQWKEKLGSFKLNTKFTLVMILLTIVPITVLMIVCLNVMEQNVIDENVSYMSYTAERYCDNIKNNANSVNMTTQYFLSDQSLKQVLGSAACEEKMTTQELYRVYNTDIAALERLVSNNLLLYGVRVYAVNDYVQEMMPILYKNSRMQKLQWAKSGDYTGWNYNYSDLLFETEERADTEKIVSFVTTIEDYEHGCLGVLETAVRMEDMFPPLFEDVEHEWSCFAPEKGGLYFGNAADEAAEQIIRAELAQEASEASYTAYRTYGSRHLIISGSYIGELQGTLFSVKDITSNIQGMYTVRRVFLAAMVVLAIGLGFVVNLIVKRLLRQFYITLTSIRQIQNGDLSVRIENCGKDEMGELGTQINKMLDRIEELMKESINRELLVKNSEIRALQNQINAHFIYNVLESIKMMAEIDEEYAISDAITSLGKLLRYSMRWVSGNVRVEEEVEYIKNYLALINLRFDYEIYLSLNISPAIMKQEIPKMSLQPIIENAIYHGIEEMAEDTNIYVKGYAQGDECVIEITDAGKGMTEETLRRVREKLNGEMDAGGGKGNGIGLKNVQDRIHISFGEEYGLQIDSKQGCYTKVAMHVPLLEKVRE